jgi:putative addiction module component (TIGR02574 family)
MINMINAEHANLLKLSPSERLLLAQDLWDSLNPEDLPLTDLQKAELDRRKVSYQANPDSSSPWDDVKRRIIEQAPHHRAARLKLSSLPKKRKTTLIGATLGMKANTSA